PGLVQNCPVPSVAELTKPSAIASPRARIASGRMKVGFTLPISAYTGIGLGRAAAVSYNARPPRSDPVKPTASIAGCCTNACPTSLVLPCTIEKNPVGKRAVSMAWLMARATISEVAGCPGCAFTTTVQPAAHAEAESPPATQNANGKLLALKTATGPIGNNIRRMSGLGAGWRSGSA